MTEEKQEKYLTYENLPELMLIDEVALFFRVTVPTAKKWLKDGSLPSSFKIGAGWRIPKEDVIAKAHSMYGYKGE